MSEPVGASAQSGCSWYRASTLLERIAILRARQADHPIDRERARRRYDRWRSGPPFQDPGLFTQRLAADGVSEDELLRLLGERTDASLENIDWAIDIERAFSTSSFTGTLPFPEDMAGQAVSGFLRAVEPLVQTRLARLRDWAAAAARAQPSAPFDPATVVGVLFASLPAGLMARLVRTLMLELNVARLQGRLAGETPEQRFQSFVDLLSRRDVALAILREYPVLARQIVICLDQWLTTSLEFLERLCHDWSDVRGGLLSGTEPGPLVHVRTDAGDRHRGGRAVIIARFQSGVRLVYKPKGLGVDQHFQELLTWINERGHAPHFRPMRLLNRGTHGWIEFIDAAPCENTDQVRRFYERQGGYLALLYLLAATDFHYENLIAAGEHPVLIDLEALFHPRILVLDQRRAADLAAGRIYDSVLTTGLLPGRIWAEPGVEGIDLSGLGAVPGQLMPYESPAWQDEGTDLMRFRRLRQPMAESHHRPMLGRTLAEPFEHSEELIEGFSALYRFLVDHRERLLAAGGPLAWFADDEVRVVMRATRSYGELMQEAFHPDVLRDGLDRDRLFDRLWAGVRDRPYLARLIASEREALQEGDIPFFLTRPGCRDLWDGAGRRIEGVLEEPSLQRVRRRLALMGPDDLRQQRWFIRGAMATLAPRPEVTARPLQVPAASSRPVDRERLLKAACAIGDRLEATALRGESDVAWIGLTLIGDSDWSLAPLGTDLYDGLPGVALFLGYLGRLTGHAGYTELARTACSTLRERLRDHAEEVVGIGAFGGWGGIIYSLCHFAALWNESDCLSEALAHAARIPNLLLNDQQFDLIGGAAGTVIALRCLHRCASSPGLVTSAAQCAWHLVKSARAAGAGIGWVTPLARTPLAGFAHGAAGIAWALVEAFHMAGESEFRETARAAIAFERGVFSAEQQNWPDLRGGNDAGNHADEVGPSMAAWCHGAAGVGLGRLLYLQRMDDPMLQAEIEIAVETTLARGFYENHCLCHGDLGNLEFISRAGEVLHRSGWSEAAVRLASAILDSIERGDWQCGNPFRIQSPGLMTGLAGIGYGLLRLAAPTKVPSVLELEPPASPEAGRWGPALRESP